VILAANAILYCWDLGINGWANYFYSAAVQSGLMDSASFFFGSSDWGNSITVDKPPLSLWIMGVSARLFGFNPVAILLPQVLIGLGSTLLIYAILKRCVAGAAALFGAIVFFTTPIVTLMSRYNNPDPLMLLLMLAALWCVLQSLESQRALPFVAAGVLLGLAFMTKQLQGMLSLPGLGVAYIIYSPQSWIPRIRILAAGTAALVLTGGLWMTIVDLVPAGNRPYIGGSPNNSVLELTLGYNGIDRIAGSGVVPNAMQVPATYRTVDSDAGFFRLLNANYNQEASWLLFAALSSVLIVPLIWKEIVRWQPVHQALFLASAVWLLTAYFLLSFMGNQIHTYYTAALAPPLALTLGTTGWPAWMPIAVLGTGLTAIAALIVRPPGQVVEAVAAGLLATAVLFCPVVTSIHNVTLSFTGSNPLSGFPSKNPAGISHLLAALKNNELPWGHDIAFGRQPDSAVISTLSTSRGCTWAAATYASQTAARLQLESGRPVMPLGGFAGSDPSPTLEEFKADVAAGKICYFVQQESFVEVQANESQSTLISKWIERDYHPEKLDGTTVYRLRN
jgi:4-amino-4-deoxy-L-arabinose transferase-like glycosyltransferase